MAKVLEVLGALDVLENYISLWLHILLSISHTLPFAVTKQRPGS